MTVKEPPVIDRDEVRRREAARRRVHAMVKRTFGLLHPGERLGDPYRDGDLDAPSLHALVAAWLDDTGP